MEYLECPASAIAADDDSFDVVLCQWITPGRLEALIPGRIQSHGGTAEVPRGAA
jgi:hypothetical protein